MFLFASALYASTIGFDYTQDDAIVITQNMFTEQGFKGIDGIFSYDTFYGFFKEAGKDQLVAGGRYRPASVATFALEQEIFGGSPMISHFINVILYGLLCMIVFYLLTILFQNHFSDKDLHLFAFVIALLFASHPIHTEVVANIKSRDEIFVGLFGLLSMYLLHSPRLTWWRITLAYLSALIAFFSKENAIVFIVIIPLSVWFFAPKDRQKKLFLLCIPILLLAGLYVYVRSQIIVGGSVSASTELMNNPFLKFEGGRMIPYNFGEKWSTIIYNLGKYIQLLIFPYPLTSDYYPYHITAKSFANPLVILSIFTHVCLGFAAFWGLVTRKAWAFGLLFYFGFLFLVSNVPFDIGTNISERFLFIPSLGFIISVVYLLFLLGESPLKKALLFPFMIVILLFSSYTVYRSQVWKNDFTLLTTDVGYSSNSAKALNGAGGALSSKAATEKDEVEKKRLLTLSNTYLDKALKIYPLYTNAYLLKGNNAYYLKEYESSINTYQKLLSIAPENKDALKNLQISLRDAGRYYGEVEKNLDKSISYMQQAYNLNPQDYETIRLLGVGYGISGQNEKALEYFLMAKDLNPNDGYTWLNAGNAYFSMGDEENGIKFHKKAMELNPDLKDKVSPKIATD